MRNIQGSLPPPTSMRDQVSTTGPGKRWRPEARLRGASRQCLTEGPREPAGLSALPTQKAAMQGGER